MNHSELRTAFTADEAQYVAKLHARESQERQCFALPKTCLKTIIPYLADRGWYFYMVFPMDELTQFASLIDESAHEKIEHILIDLARTHTADIHQVACAQWPQRAKILADAFDAHHRGLYTLSIPVMLAQADGICNEMVQCPLFTRSARKSPKTRLGTFPTIEGLADILLWSLYHETGLSENTTTRNAKRKTDPMHSPLNRHGVLHGLDANYATEANSLRAIVVLGYLQKAQISLRAIEEVEKTIATLTRGTRPLAPPTPLGGFHSVGKI